MALQSAPKGRPRLLVVDDDALIADTLSFALGAEFEVHACESRLHAIELLRQLPEAPQLALVDLGLPPTLAGWRFSALTASRRQRAPGLHTFPNASCRPTIFSAASFLP